MSLSYLQTFFTVLMINLIGFTCYTCLRSNSKDIVMRSIKYTGEDITFGLQSVMTYQN